MFDFKTILQGTNGIQHIVQGVKIGTPNGITDTTIYTNGTNISTVWNNKTILRNRYDDGEED